MSFSDKGYSLSIELDTKGCDLSAGEVADMEEDLHTLRKLVADFPVANLYITVVHHAKREDYHVKTTLTLSGNTLFSGDRDVDVHPAYERCVRKLVKKVEAYKQRIHDDSKLAKKSAETHHALTPAQVIDADELKAAVLHNDYARFRRAADPYEEGLSQRIGRWITRYPEIESGLGVEIRIADIVEDIFLNAFEQFERRPKNVPLGDWFEELIDPSIQAFIHSPDEEFTRISFKRAFLEE